MPLGLVGNATGIEETIRDLARLDPDIKKQLRADAKVILRPLVDDAKRRYPEKVLSGMRRNWQKGRIFPYDQAAARRGVKISVSTSLRKSTILKVFQSNPAAAVIETAGHRTFNPMGMMISYYFGRRDRFMWGAATDKLPKVEYEMRQAIIRLIRRHNRKN